MTNSSKSSSVRLSRCSRASSSNSRTSPTIPPSGCCAAIATGSASSTTTSRARRRSALRVTGGKLTDHKLLFLGAGEAATGSADLVVSAMVAQGSSEAEARRRNWLFDSQGLIVKDRAKLAEHKLPLAHEHSPVGDFLTAIRTLKPTAIIGVAAVGGTFTPEVLQCMAELNERPIVFALSNPTTKAECSAEEAYRHTEGRALFACGSPYPPVTMDGKTFVPRQGNNSYIFPGVGRGDRERHL